MAKTQLRLNLAQRLAEKIKLVLAPGCARIEEAGSVRRQKEYVGDIEFVIIPERAPSLFDDVQGESLLDPILRTLLEQERLLPGDRNGAEIKQFRLPAMPDLNLELFICTPEQWPILFAIRTGPSEFSKQLVTQRNKRTPGGRPGLLPSHLKIRDGWRLWDGERYLNTGSEREFLELCGGWIEPRRRK